MNDTIRKLYLRGMSLATAVMLAGSLVACDETIDLPDGLISDTVSITQPSESRPNVSETLAPEDTEPEDTKPEETKPEETEPIAPELSDEDKALLQNFYNELAKFSPEYSKGIARVSIFPISEFNPETNENVIQSYSIKISTVDSPKAFVNCYSCNMSAEDGATLIELGKKYFKTINDPFSVLLDTTTAISNENPIEFYRHFYESILQLEPQL